MCGLALHEIIHSPPFCQWQPRTLDTRRLQDPLWVWHGLHWADGLVCGHQVKGASMAHPTKTSREACLSWTQYCHELRDSMTNKRCGVGLVQIYSLWRLQPQLRTPGALVQVSFTAYVLGALLDPLVPSGLLLSQIWSVLSWVCPSDQCWVCVPSGRLIQEPCL
jgi:hypothetical protein